MCVRCKRRGSIPSCQTPNSARELAWRGRGGFQGRTREPAGRALGGATQINCGPGVWSAESAVSSARFGARAVEFSLAAIAHNLTRLLEAPDRLRRAPAQPVAQHRMSPGCGRYTAAPRIQTQSKSPHQLCSWAPSHSAGQSRPAKARELPPPIATFIFRGRRKWGRHSLAGRWLRCDRGIQRRGRCYRRRLGRIFRI